MLTLLVLLSAPDCHLCAHARAVLDDLRCERGGLVEAAAPEAAGKGERAPGTEAANG